MWGLRFSCSFLFSSLITIITIITNFTNFTHQLAIFDNHQPFAEGSRVEVGQGVTCWNECCLGGPDMDSGESSGLQRVAVRVGCRTP